MSQNTTAEEFARRFERPRLPVVITGLCDDWPAAQAWTPEALMERFAHHKFKVGSGRAMCHPGFILCQPGLKMIEPQVF